MKNKIKNLNLMFVFTSNLNETKTSTTPFIKYRSVHYTSTSTDLNSFMTALRFLKKIV